MTTTSISEPVVASPASSVLIGMSRRHEMRKPYFLLRLLIVVTLLLPLFFSYRHSSAQSGVLIPSTGSKPDANTLSLQVMNVDVLIDNQHARVKVMQIFDSHSAQVLEGKYLFERPSPKPRSRRSKQFEEV